MKRYLNRLIFFIIVSLVFIINSSVTIPPCPSDQFKIVKIRLVGVLGDPSFIPFISFNANNTDCTGLPAFSYNDPFKLIDYTASGWQFGFSYLSQPLQSCTYLPGTIIDQHYLVCGSSRFSKNNLSPNWQATSEITILTNNIFQVKLLKNKNNICMVRFVAPCGNCIIRYNPSYYVLNNVTGIWQHKGSLIYANEVANATNPITITLNTSSNFEYNTYNKFTYYDCSNHGNCYKY